MSEFDSKVTSEEMLDYLASLVPPNQQEGDVTISMLIERTGRSRNFCARLMEQLVKKGEMEKIRGVDTNGNPAWLYRPKRK